MNIDDCEGNSVVRVDDAWHLKGVKLVKQVESRKIRAVFIFNFPRLIYFPNGE
jgi:hypothetical protein